MVKPIAVGIIIAVVIIAVFLAGALAVTGNLTLSLGSRDPQGVLLEAAQRRTAVDSYNLTYAIDYDIRAGAERVRFGGRLETEKNADRTRLLNSLTPADEQGAAGTALVDVEIYVIDSVTYACYRLPQLVCQRAGDAPPQTTPAEQSEQLLQLIRDGAVKLSPGTAKTIAGRACDSVIVDYDIKKLTQNVPGGVPDVVGKIEYMRQTWCFERESGLPLEQNMELRMLADAGTATATLNTVAKSFSLRAGEIRLPAEPTDSVFPFLTNESEA